MSVANQVKKKADETNVPHFSCSIVDLQNNFSVTYGDQKESTPKKKKSTSKSTPVQPPAHEDKPNEAVKKNRSRAGKVYSKAEPARTKTVPERPQTPVDLQNNFSVTCGEQKESTPKKKKSTSKSTPVQPSAHEEKTEDAVEKLRSRAEKVYSKAEPTRTSPVPPPQKTPDKATDNSSEPKKDSSTVNPRKQKSSVRMVLVGAVFVFLLVKMDILPQRNWLPFFVLICFAFWGGLSFLRAWTGLNREIAEFEKNRDRELNTEIKDLLKRSPHLRARDSFFRELLEKEFSADCNDTRWHHQARLKMIVDSAFPEEEEQKSGYMPTLDELHALTLLAEHNRHPVRVLNTITSIFLIMGILGTLYGVHESLPFVAAERIELKDVADALLPSAFAVICTIILIILRSLYRHKVNLLLGRLDRHTLRFYFPLFRLDELNEQTIKELDNGVTELGLSFKGIAGSIQLMEEIPAKIEGTGRQLEAVAGKLDSVSRSLIREKSFLKEKETIEERLNNLADNFKCQSERLKSAVVSLTEKLLSVRELLVEGTGKYRRYCLQMADTPQHLTNIHDTVSRMQGVSCQRMLELQNEVAGVKGLLERIHRDGQSIGEIQKEVVSQASQAKEVLQGVQEQSESLKDKIDKNGTDYKSYQEYLLTQYSDMGEKLNKHTVEIEKFNQGLMEMEDNLKKQIQEYEKSSSRYWWEWSAVLLLLFLYITNVFWALNR